jgi:hypothetical protein
VDDFELQGAGSSVNAPRKAGFNDTRRFTLRKGLPLRLAQLTGRFRRNLVAERGPSKVSNPPTADPPRSPAGQD